MPFPHISYLQGEREVAEVLCFQVKEIPWSKSLKSQPDREGLPQCWWPGRDPSLLPRGHVSIRCPSDDSE